MALALLAASGCGASVEKAGSSDAHRGGPVTVTNCGHKTTFRHTPRRVVTNDIGITEIMFALGLEDRMAGYVMPDDKGSVAKSPFRSSYRKATWLSKKRITKELVVDAKADMVFAGWGYGFSEDNGLTPDALHDLGIGSYLLSESCRSGGGSSRGTMAPLDALYTDLRNLGRIFHVEKRARKLVHRYRAQVAEASKGAPKEHTRPKVFLYDSGQDKPFTAGRYAGPDDIITRAGGRNAMHGVKDTWTQVGWESVVDSAPDVILINDYGTPSAAAKKKFLTSYGPLKHTPAVEKNRFFTLDYVDLVESPRNPAAIAKLASYLRAHRG